MKSSVILDIKAVAGTLGVLLFFLGAALLMPMAVALWYGEASWWSFGSTALIAFTLGGSAWQRYGGTHPDLGIREGFAIVALVWVLLSLIGGLPYVFAGLTSYTDAFFETMSGFTTTGATILGGANTPAIEAMPNGFLFWRSLTHWLGGMGIIVLTLAILPILGVGGMQLFKAEVPGPSADKLTPRVRETAKRLWLIYVGFTVLQVVLLLPAMNLFDAINHAFATMATGGFSTENNSVGQYGSAYIDGIITVFMFLAGINFALHYRLLRGQRITVFKDTEFRTYCAIIGLATLFLTLALWRPTEAAFLHMGQSADAYVSYPSILEAFRYAAFQAVAIITTTGFGTADYMLWSPLAIGVLFALFFVGGMAGSTGGGVKVIRHVLMFKNSFKELRQLIHPHAILHVRLNGHVVSQDVMRNVLSFIVLFFGLIGIGTLTMSILGLDLASAFGVTISSVGNVGPAFGNFGPAENYASIPAIGKWVLSFLMMAGRLEIFTVLIVFMPAFWKR